MNVTRSVLAAWLLAVVVPAQAGDAPKPPANPAEYDQLVADWTVAQKAYSEAMKEMQNSEEYKKARTDKDAAKIKELADKLHAPGKDFGPRALALADKLFAAAAPLAAGTEYADRIGAPIFEKDRLQVGMEVPDIAGEDVDGVAFKLSDYRGKVVMIDFWGFW